MHKNVILIEEGKKREVWGSLAKACREKGLPYHTLKTRDFPFGYQSLTFYKIKFNHEG